MIAKYNFILLQILIIWQYLPQFNEQVPNFFVICRKIYYLVNSTSDGLKEGSHCPDHIG